MQFHYRALDANGGKASGAVEAEALPAAIEQLHRRGLAPFRIEPVGTNARRLRVDGWPRAKLSLLQRAHLIRQVATLVMAGITLDRALLLAGADAKNGKPPLVLERAHAALVAGAPLSRSLAQSAAGFTATEIGLVRAGEQSGNLAAALGELAASLERQYEARGKLASALVYPAFLLCLAPTSLVIIALVLVPNIAPLFEHSQAEMPLTLRAMVLATDELTLRGPLWLALAALLLFVGLWAGTKAGVRSWFRELAPALPLLGGLIRRRELAQLSLALAALLSGGMALQAALLLVQDAVSVASSRRGLAEALEIVMSGGRLSEALKRVPFFDPPTLKLVAAGEKSNRLPDMLRLIGVSGEKAAERSIERFMTILTPVITVAIGLLVGGVVMSVMQAILSVNEMATR